MQDYELGLDMGVASLGWTVVSTRPSDPNPKSIEKLGVHRFEAGVSEPGKMGFGKEESSAKPRREARQMRRQLWRRKLRLQRLIQLMQKHGLMPQGDVEDSESRHAFLRQIDAEIEVSRFGDCSPSDRLKLPYLLRATAVRERIELHELGRVLYHLAQRRGFLSNRKTDREDDKEQTKFKKDIGELADRIVKHDPPYLGAYLASLNPDEARLRGQRTSRSMYLFEFEAIWTQQQRHHPSLRDEDLKHSIHKAIFHQRRLRSQHHLIGRCSLTGRIRAPMAVRDAQRFRLLCSLNNLEIIATDGSARPLTRDERATVLALQEATGDVAFSKLKTKKVLGLPADATFNLAAQEKKLIGHRTDAKLRKALGDTFDRLSTEQLDAIINDLRSFRQIDALARRLTAAYPLTTDETTEISKIKLEDSRASHSIEAIRALLPLLEQGIRYATARQRMYPESFEKQAEAADLLPPVLDWLKQDERAVINNPAVLRGLTETRKVVNAIIRRYGKPSAVRLEIARDLKNSRKRRAEMSSQNQERRTQREQAAERLASEYGVAQPRREDIEKVLLLWECQSTCPYTGKHIEPSDLFGSNPSYQVEHIWPLSVSMDDSFTNKTLCHVDENARKGGRAPIDCYDADRLGQIKARVAEFNADHRTKAAKLRRFTEPVPADFAQRHLNDTRYLAREAKRYLESLYSQDDDGQRVFVVTGGLTALLRGLWGLNRLVGGPANDKERTDHRHHALDALVVALTEPLQTQKLHTAAARAESMHARRDFIDVQPPWDGFLDDARAAVEKVNVSHRPNRRLRGKLHKETFYSDPIHKSYRVRRELHSLKVSEIDKIVSTRDREAVKDALDRTGQKDPAKAFTNPANLPVLTDRNGRQTRIRKVRIAAKFKPHAIGKKSSHRNVQLGSNHHTTISRDKSGKWIEQTVSLYEAMRRQSSGEPIVQPPEGQEFVYSLFKNDHLIIDSEEWAGVWRVDSIAQDDIELVRQHDARTSDQRKKEKDRFRLSSSKRWTTLQPRKVTITHLGEIEDAGG
ncbi:MAG: type II CRISPR RNA-guided endonuclease Cas9 [Planctomycetota bacterium]